MEPTRVTEFFHQCAAHRGTYDAVALFAGLARRNVARGTASADEHKILTALESMESAAETVVPIMAAVRRGTVALAEKSEIEQAINTLFDGIQDCGAALVRASRHNPNVFFEAEEATAH